MENILLWILFIVIISLNFLALGYYYEKIEILKTLTMAVVLFWMEYAILSGLWFLIDKFSFIAVLVNQAIIVGLITIYLCARANRKAIKLVSLKKQDWLIFLIVFVAFLLSYTKFDLYMMGQDQGLYQAEALELYMGDYEVEHDFEEYNILQKDEDKEAYKEMLDKEWPGYYIRSSSQYMSTTPPKSEVSGVYHGVQTFPAMLALMGRLFGMRNMIHVQTIFYLCSIILVCYALVEMRVPYKIQFLLSLLFAMSPLLLWLSKASYTEMFLTMLVSYYLYLIEENCKNKWIIAMPLIAFSFVHVSFLILWPCFWIVNTILYLSEKNKQYIYVNIASSLGLFVGDYMMAHIAVNYFYANCSRLYISNIITSKNLLSWIGILVIISCIISILLLRMKSVKSESLIQYIKKYKWIISAFLGLCMIYIVWHAVKVGYFSSIEDAPRSDIYQYYGRGYIAFSHLAIYACAMATGFIILPILYIGMMLKPDKAVENYKSFVITVMFLYIVVLQSAVIRVDIPYFYYYSRYLAYYIPVIMITVVPYVNNYSKKILVPVFSLSLCSMLLFDQAIIRGKDDTILEWETVEDLDLAIQDDSALILCGKKVQQTYGSYIRSVTRAAVFPDFEDMDAQMTLLLQHYDNVYILCENEYMGEKYGEHVVQTVYQDLNTSSENKSFICGLFPVSMVETNDTVILYQVGYNKLADAIGFSSDNRDTGLYVVSGMFGSEGSYAWTKGNEVAIRFRLDSSYAEEKIHVDFGINNIINTKQTVQVYVNGQFACEKVITFQDMSLGADFEPDKDGNVEIKLLLPDAISPKELGISEDNRQLGIALTDLSIVGQN